MNQKKKKTSHRQPLQNFMNTSELTDLLKMCATFGAHFKGHLCADFFILLRMSH